MRLDSHTFSWCQNAATDLDVVPFLLLAPDNGIQPSSIWETQFFELNRILNSVCMWMWTSKLGRYVKHPEMDCCDFVIWPVTTVVVCGILGIILPTINTAAVPGLFQRPERLGRSNVYVALTSLIPRIWRKKGNYPVNYMGFIISHYKDPLKESV